MVETAAQFSSEAFLSLSAFPGRDDRTHLKHCWVVKLCSFLPFCLLSRGNNFPPLGRYYPKPSWLRIHDESLRRVFFQRPIESVLRRIYKYIKLVYFIDSSYLVHTLLKKVYNSDVREEPILVPQVTSS